ncbi:MAG: FliM/FliN family flagellar motor C-terminal domain-containing protein [Pirellulales bacterium]|nr:FliM/FliN family flagellar motor C-terminal domain-containing protein [Pirellulales bacterium]
MADFNAQLGPDILAACQAGAAEAGEAFSRTFDRQLTLGVGEVSTLALAGLPACCQGPGLAIVLGVGSAAAVVLVPKSSGVLPDWYAEPDATGKSKLTTLAQELGMLLLPDACAADDFLAAAVPELSASLVRGGAADGAGLVLLELISDGAPAPIALVWPLPNKAAILTPAAPVAPAAESRPARPAAPEPAAAPPPPPRMVAARSVQRATGGTLEELPKYGKSLLRIEVPLQVVLAEKKQSVSRIVELGPGSIIHFDKSCDEMLTLCVGGLPIGKGEAVKVGDKFGLRLTSLLLPDERFKPAQSA